MNLGDLRLPEEDNETEFRIWLSGRISAAHAEREAGFDECLTRPCSGNYDSRIVSDEAVRDAIIHTQSIYQAGLPEVVRGLEAAGGLSERLVRESLGNWAMVVVGGFDTIKAALFHARGRWDSAAHRAVEKISDNLLEERSALLFDWLDRVAAEQKGRSFDQEMESARAWIVAREGSYKTAWPLFKSAFSTFPHEAFVSLWREVKGRGKGRPRRT